MIIIARVVGISITTVSLFCASLGAQTRPIVVLGGTLIDGTGRPAVSDVVIVMQGGRFQQVGKRGEVSLPPQAEIIDASGKTILPGLIDGHCHYREWVRGDLFLAYGVTTCPDLSGHEDPKWILNQRSAIHRGEIRGPRLWVVVRHVDGPRGIEAPMDRSKETIVVTTPEEARKAVRDLVSMGADGVKLFESMKPELATAAVEEAHSLQRPVFGHTLDISASADAGYQGVEHSWAVVFSCIHDPKKKADLAARRLRGPAAIHLGVGEHFLYLQPDFYDYLDPKMFDPLIRVMVDNNVHWSPTWANLFWPLSPQAGALRQEQLDLLQDPHFFTAPSIMARKVEQIWDTYALFTPERRTQLLTGQEKLATFARRFVAAGGKLHAGSDPDYVLPAFSLYLELRLFVEAGLSPAQAIQAASLNVAQAWHKDRDYGSVEQGKAADLVIFGRDPLRHAITTQDVEKVFQDGRLVAGWEYNKR